jgi:multicomponent Na+:H+ antiporter subunit E
LPRPPRQRNPVRSGRWVALAVRAAVLAAGWLILTAGARDGLGYGAAVVLLALLVSVGLGPPARTAWRPLGLLRFAGFFLHSSLRGGVDVARRALSPRRAISPQVTSYRTRLPAGAARDLFNAALSLMPGTLSVDRDGPALQVHVLAATADETRRSLARLEDRIAGGLGVSLASGDEADG